MSIFEYDEEEHMRQEREQSWNKGMREGIIQSEQKLLWNPIQKKLEKGKSISQIAEELETTEEEIQAAIEEMNKKTFTKSEK